MEKTILDELINDIKEQDFTFEIEMKNGSSKIKGTNINNLSFLYVLKYIFEILQDRDVDVDETVKVAKSLIRLDELLDKLNGSDDKS